VASAEVTVWAIPSTFVQTTVLPMATSMTGSNERSRMTVYRTSATERAGGGGAGVSGMPSRVGTGLAVRGPTSGTGGGTAVVVGEGGMTASGAGVAGGVGVGLIDSAD